MKYSKVIIALLLMLAPFFVTHTHAQQPSAAQIAQFKNLSKEEKLQVMRSFGIEPSDLVDLNAQPQISASSAPITQSIPAHKRPEKQTIEQAAAEASNVADTGIAKPTGEQKLKQFGYDLFEGAPSTFAPATDIPVPSEYVLGPGDTVVVQLYGKDNASYNLVVNREGQIQFPEIGPLSVAGLNFEDFKTLIQQTVQEQMIGVKAAITMGALRSIRIFVLGDANYPGSYTVSSLTTITNALFASGGISKIGSLRNIQLKRNGKLITTLDLYDLLLRGDTSKDKRLLPGDVIFIPPIGATVGISGEIRRPAIYEINSEKSAAELIKLSGGFLSTAYPSASRVARINRNNERTIIDLNLSNTDVSKSFRLRDGDVFSIQSVLDSVEDVVVLEGHVKRSGGFAWKSGLRVSDVIGSADDLLPNPDLNAALIIRESQPTRYISVVQFSLADAITKPKSNADILLEPRDKILVFDYESDRSVALADTLNALKIQASKQYRRKIVTIGGYVRFPGEYPLVEGMHVADLIAVAGGLTEQAYSLGAEITRHSYNKNEEQRIEHISVLLSTDQQQLLTEEDHLHINRLPNWIGTETVEVSGEVAFPGTYAIQRGETLSQLVKRAGGLNQYAFPEGAIFTREELRRLEEQRIKELQKRLESDIAAASLEQQDPKTKIAVQDADTLLESLNEVKPMGRMVIDLNNILDHPESNDIQLRTGDRLIIPREKQSVTVVGEVQLPTSHIFQESLDAEDYIEQSGGTTPKADKQRIYVVKANGRVFLPERSNWFAKGYQLSRGDTVVVPLDADRIKPLTLWTSVSQIFYQIALGAAAIASF